MSISIPTILDFGDFLTWIDGLSNNILGPIICFVIFSIIFIDRQKEGTVNAYLLASFSTTIIGIILSLIPLITPAMVTMLLSMTLIGAAIRVFVE